MADETATVPPETKKMKDVSAPSTSAEQVDGDDVDAEAKRLLGVGSKHLVMKDIRSAVNAFQEASSLLGKKYGETADQCADAFYYYGMALLELGRMETNVLGNALEGMPEEEDDECEKEDPNIPSAANLDEKEREQLREQVLDAMAEKEDKCDKEEKSDKENGESKEPKTEESKAEEMECEKSSEAPETKEKADGEAAEVEKAPEEAEVKPETSSEAAGEEKSTTATAEEGKTKEESKTAEGEADSTQGPGEKPEDKSEGPGEKPEDKSEGPRETPEDKSEAKKKPEDKSEGAEDSEAAAKPEETASTEEKEDKTAGDEEAEPMEGEEEEGSESDGNEETEEKESEEDDVGNLQLAWEMLELSKIIFKRQQEKESQLKAAQAHLKLGEVSIESENYTQAVEDFLACLTIQKAHLEEHDRLLAETNYQLGLAYQYSSKHDDAISHFTQSIEVIEKRLVLLTEQLEKAAEDSKEEPQKEMDELKGLLPDIKEKIEDSKEAQKTSEDTDKALKETLGGTSSGFPKENGGTSTSAAAAEKSGDSTVPVTNCVSDISHLVRKKRKPEEESPLKDAKKSKPEPVENGSGNGDAVVPTSEQVEKAEEAENQTPMETAAVESTA